MINVWKQGSLNEYEEELKKKWMVGEGGALSGGRLALHCDRQELKFDCSLPERALWLIIDLLKHGILFMQHTSCCCRGQSNTAI